MPYWYDGSTFDRARQVVNAQDTTGAGIQAVGPLCQFDDVSPGAVTENQWAPCRITSARAIMIDGSATTQPISGTVTVGTFPDNEPFNLAQISGTAASVNNGNVDAGTLRVTVAADSTGQIDVTDRAARDLGGVDILTEIPAGTQNIGDVDVASLPNEGQQTAANSISTTIDTDNDNIGTTGAAVPGEAALIAGTDGTNVTVPYIDPCQREAKTYVEIDQTSGEQIAAGVASERIIICSINLVTATAQNVALVSGTGAVCATSTSGLEGFGGSTAGTGWNFAANGGLTYGNGSSSLGQTDTDQDNVCLFQSAGGQVSGGISYVSL
jgi:hypothetical protein